MPTASEVVVAFAFVYRISFVVLRILDDRDGGATVSARPEGRETIFRLLPNVLGSVRDAGAHRGDLRRSLSTHGMASLHDFVARGD
eukprot:CAMPEP_0194771352 /NCGR_PEP_ID=MMETSP0323_2-20130528/48981_1 /TAXON_ID=2866 ORGANISM="Crypthecodinium cohnii, Strain Seligo" /NCGR_SAMPLE_ID=MMETSP0323_2 /ASSEMBLY_ACC=CAM_ASM_000346 /LENGTH=85 /DNA_ID=CAMNT_0039705421 /DNA_START=363 /DNA_END=621 /DNA_ORIENTATION=+